MKEFRPGDLVPDCDEGVSDDSYDDLIFEVVAQANAEHSIRDLFDAVVGQVRPVPPGDRACRETPFFLGRDGRAT